MIDQKKMLFWEHIEELRKKIIRCFIVIFIIMIILMNNTSILFDKIIFAPSKKNFVSYFLLKKILNIYEKNLKYDFFFKEDLNIQNRKLFGQFNVYVWTCFIGGIILSFPYILYELWTFVSPALSKNEKKFSEKILVLGIFLFLFGALFGYFILCPFLIHFGYSFIISEIPKNVFDLSDYIYIITSSVFLMGIVFLFPFFIFLLTKLEIISFNFLKKYRKHAFLIILIIASAITPGDLISTIIVLIPLLILYQISIYISYFFHKKNPH